MHRLVPVYCLTIAVTILLCLACCPGTASAQLVQNGSWWLSMEMGPAMYFGEFNSLEQKGAFGPKFGNDLGVSIRCQANQYLSIGGYLGYMRVPYALSDTARLKYSNGFLGQTDAATYPGSNVELTPENRIKMFRYHLMFEGRYGISDRVFPFIAVGIGYMSFSPLNSNYVPLPTNRTGTYGTGTLIVPLGLGVNYVLNDQLQLYVRAAYYITRTDYLDGYAHYLDFEAPGTNPIGPGQKPTPNDYVASVTFGLSGRLVSGRRQQTGETGEVAELPPEPSPPAPDEPRTAPPDGKPPEVERLPIDSAKPVVTNDMLQEEAERQEFSNIYFHQNTDNFDLSRPETIKNLRELLDYMRSCEDLRVLVEGHSSAEGDSTWNRRLSGMRARRVRDWLVANGISREKFLGTIGYGPKLPKVDEPPGTDAEKLEELRKQNRRITVLVRKKC